MDESRDLVLGTLESTEGMRRVPGVPSHYLCFGVTDGRIRIRRQSLFIFFAAWIQKSRRIFDRINLPWMFDT